MSSELTQHIEAMGLIFTEMERRRKEDPDDFKDLLDQADGNFGIAYAFLFLLVEDNLRDRMIIKRHAKKPQLLECIYGN
jgi:hypothetical protein